jgi:co-chaperonin GroES (HSP10)
VCNHFNAIAVERDGKLIPVGAYILLEPIKEGVLSSDIIHIPDHYKEKICLKAKVIASNDPEVPVGSTVMSEEVGQFENEFWVDGKKKTLYCALNSNVLAIYEEEAEQSL